MCTTLNGFDEIILSAQPFKTDSKAGLQLGPGLGIHSKCQDLKTTLPSLTQQLGADVNGSPKPGI